MILPKMDISSPKSLYLLHGRGWRVALDGPVLRIDATRSATRFAALSKIARVVSATDTVWQTDALLACLKVGIPVIFVDGQGHTQGYCHGKSRRETTLAGLLTEAIEHPEWMQRYDDWLAVMHARQIRQAFALAGVSKTCNSRATARSRLCTAWQARKGHIVTSLLHHIDGLVYALVVEHMKSAVGVARFMGHPRAGISLTNDFAALLSWSCYGLLEGVEKDDIVNITHQRLSVQIVEEHRKSLVGQLKDLIDANEMWLRAWIQEAAD
jgi:hypothetical protein